jgi:hypothetical protein
VTLVELASLAAAGLLAGVVVFQVALAGGLPLGEATMGGRAATVKGVLTPPYRALAAASAVVLVFAAWIVLARAGLVSAPLGGRTLAWSAWAVAVLMGLNTMSNLSGRHPVERWGMASITLATALLVGGVAYAAQ